MILLLFLGVGTKKLFQFSARNFFERNISIIQASKLGSILLRNLAFMKNSLMN
jgi:hypothetical protein